MTDTLTHLEELLAKATKGRLIAHGWGDGSTQMGMTNVFNEDAEVLLMECIPENDATLIVEAINALPALIARQRELERVLEGFVMDLTSSLKNQNRMLTINHDALVRRIGQARHALAKQENSDV